MKKTLFYFLFAIGVISACNKDDTCPTGYTGSSCSTQITPSKIIVSKIEVIRFPATDANGAGWDLTSGADIYPEISYNGSVVYTSSTYYTDANPNSIYVFDLSPSFDVHNPLSTYTIRLYDYDNLDADDYMGGITFTPYESSNNFPSVITIDAGGAVAFKLHLTYIF